MFSQLTENWLLWYILFSIQWMFYGNCNFVPLCSSANLCMTNSTAPCCVYPCIPLYTLLHTTSSSTRSLLSIVGYIACWHSTTVTFQSKLCVNTIMVRNNSGIRNRLRKISSNLPRELKRLYHYWNSTNMAPFSLRSFIISASHAWSLGASKRLGRYSSTFSHIDIAIPAQQPRPALAAMVAKVDQRTNPEGSPNGDLHCSGMTALRCQRHHDKKKM